MSLNGSLLIGSAEVVGTAGRMRAFDPAKGEEMEPAFTGASEAEIDRACTLADAAFDSYRETPVAVRAAFLRSIGAKIVALGDVLIERAMAESGLPKARLEGERGRTVFQLEMFAALLEENEWQGAVFDAALPDRKPAPRPDLRLRQIALGPVAIFGASNFPLAFSVAGGDTASALAAGCPVVVKAHPAHPGTSELVGRVIQKAVAESGLHEGVFSLVAGTGNAVGQSLVQHPAIKAVGFTGSRQGGLSLVQTAAARPEPIPVYAEMSSINPVVVLGAALEASAETLSKGFVDSLVLGVGQFCTNPGLVLGVQSAGFDRFMATAVQELGTRPGGVMLTAGIHAAYGKGTTRLQQESVVKTLVKPEQGEGVVGKPGLFSVPGKDFLASPQLGEEVFGPTSLFVVCASQEELRSVIGKLEGQLTATLLAEEGDAAEVRALLPLLERKVGRIVYNGFPTGVEVARAMVHGGPFPATSDSRTSSVGTIAMERFLRPVCYQNVPFELLPEVLQQKSQA